MPFESDDDHNILALLLIRDHNKAWISCNRRKNDGHKQIDIKQGAKRKKPTP